jgi:hypothetical protein
VLAAGNRDYSGALAILEFNRKTGDDDTMVSVIQMRFRYHHHMVFSARSR